MVDEEVPDAGNQNALQKESTVRMGRAVVVLHEVLVLYWATRCLQMTETKYDSITDLKFTRWFTYDVDRVLECWHCADMASHTSKLMLLCILLRNLHFKQL